MSLEERILIVREAIEKKIQRLDEDYSLRNDEGELDRLREDSGEIEGYRWILWNVGKHNQTVDSLTQKAIEDRLSDMEDYLSVRYQNVAENAQGQTAYERYGPQATPPENEPVHSVERDR